MNHISVLKTAHNVDNGIYLTDIGKELVSKTFTL